jgi:hypothetical protein
MKGAANAANVVARAAAAALRVGGAGRQPKLANLESDARVAIMRTLWTVVGLGCVALASVACGGASSSDDGEEDNGDLGALSGDEAELRTGSLTIPSGGSKSFNFTTDGSAVAIDIDCSPPADPDSVGPVFTIEAPALKLPSNETAKAGAFAWSGTMDAGDQTVTLHSVSGAQHCSVKVGGAGSAGGACKTFKSYRSPNTNHTHFAVGEESSADWEAFPASGNHWGAWAPWNRAYATPVRRPFMMHNLEHGGAVLSYKCDSNAAAECAEAEAKLKDLVDSLHLTRYLITPDPTQPEMFAVRTWRWLYTSSCLDVAPAKAFLHDHMQKGREDIDADPPVSFDPTTTDVPCQDLMAAPDSCY